MSSRSATEPIAVPAERRRPSLLARRSRARRQPSLEQIFSDHHQEIYRYCLAIVRIPADAEDALQATMAAAVRTLAQEDREIAIRPWLYRVAHNEAISIIRRRRERPGEEGTADAVTDSPGEQLEQRERLRTLVADLQALPDRQRSGLVMRELSGLSYEEIAAALGCGEGAARQVVYEARSALAVRVEGREMECEEARRALSDGDGRRLRGRRLKAHLGSCEPCSDFRAAIVTRRQDLAALCPPVPVAAAGGLLAALMSGSSGGVATSSATAGVAAVGAGTAAGVTGLAGSAAVKGASIAAATVIAAGAADLSGIVELPGPLQIGGQAVEAETGPAGGGSTPIDARSAAGADGWAAIERGRDERRGAASAERDADSRAGGRSKANAKGVAPASEGRGAREQPAVRAPVGPRSGSSPGSPSAPGGGGGHGQTGGNPSPGPPASQPTAPPAGGFGGGGAATPPTPAAPESKGQAAPESKGQGTPAGGRPE